MWWIYTQPIRSPELLSPIAGAVSEGLQIIGLTPAARRGRFPLYCTLLRAIAAYCISRGADSPKKGAGYTKGYIKKL